VLPLEGQGKGLSQSVYKPPQLIAAHIASAFKFHLVFLLLMVLIHYGIREFGGVQLSSNLIFSFCSSNGIGSIVAKVFVKFDISNSEGKEDAVS
jgi:hypothetical protein